MYLAKDFIETPEGLAFAVVENGLELGRVLCFLRYVLTNGNWSKVNTEQANQLLQTHYPDFLYYSIERDTSLHAVSDNRIKSHHQPRVRLQELMGQEPVDAVHADLQVLLDLYQTKGIGLDNIGVTGSLLLGAHNTQSDIDLVVYNRQTFNQLRSITEQLIAADRLQVLSTNDWQSCYQRRSCEISLEDYIWHEQRKLNKAMINGRKFDLGLVTVNTEPPRSYKKIGFKKCTATVTDDQRSFDYPAIFQIDCPDIAEIVCYTATYFGQAFTGETVEVAGLVEQSQGRQRLIVGSSREAGGEYIKVIKHN